MTWRPLHIIASVTGMFRSMRTLHFLNVNAELAKFANALEKVTVDTVEAGFMTKDLALLVGPDEKYLSTTGFPDKIDANRRRGQTTAHLQLVSTAASAAETL